MPKITMEESELTALIRTLTEAVEAVKAAPQPAVGHGDEFEEAEKVARRMTERHLKPRPFERTEIPIECPETGSLTIAACENGRICSLVPYITPPEATIHQEHGGRVPNGLEIKLPDGKDNKSYLAWKWHTYWQRDLKTYCGDEGMPGRPQAVAEALRVTDPDKLALLEKAKAAIQPAFGVK